MQTFDAVSTASPWYLATIEWLPVFSLLEVKVAESEPTLPDSHHPFLDPDSSIAALPPGVGAIYVVVTDPDALYARAKARGASITREMRDEDTAHVGSRRAIPKA